MKSLAKKILSILGLYPIAQLCKEFAVRPSATASELRMLTVLRREAAGVFRRLDPVYAEKRVLIMGFGSVSAAALHAVVIGAFRLAGYEPVVLLPGRSITAESAYRALGVKRLVFLSERDEVKEDKLAGRVMTLGGERNDLLALTHLDCHVGQAALSGLMRQLRVGSPDLKDPSVRAQATLYLSSSMRAAEQVARIVAKVNPQAIVVTDRYTPSAQLFDLGIANGLPVVNVNAGHRNNILMLKCYNASNREAHPFSLSDVTWRRLRQTHWDGTSSVAVMNELECCYRSGEWFSEVGTQLNAEFFDRDLLLQELRLDPQRKTAVVFPHIFWDGTFFWGKDIFSSYEEWFVHTITHAAQNENLNWIIKVHPANMVKDIRDGYRGVHNEISAIKKTLRKMPAHVHVLPAQSRVSTLSLFGIADYCLTVRGTVGMEAACFGIPVVTAGTGRYDGKGFTRDPQSVNEYSGVLADLHRLERMTGEQVELAQRFAYGALLCRPLPLEAINMSYSRDVTARLCVSIKARTEEGFFASPDVRALSRWIETDEEDFILPGCAVTLRTDDASAYSTSSVR